MEKKPIEVECAIRAEMTVILPVDIDVFERKFGGDYGALRDEMTLEFCAAMRETAACTHANMRVDDVRCRVFVKDEIGGGEE